MKRFLLLAVYLMSAWAHTNAPEGAKSEVATATGAASNTVREGFGHAVLTPARDLNLMRDPIPPALLSISQVYQIERPVTCEALNQELATLDDALGPDTSIGEDEETDDPKATGSSAGEFALDALSDTTGSLIPFRGLIRRATGAHEWDKRAREAYLTGLLRRAHLKGIWRVLECDKGGDGLYMPSDLNVETPGKTGP
jgi:hypothetical protein